MPPVNTVKDEIMLWYEKEKKLYWPNGIFAQKTATTKKKKTTTTTILYASMSPTYFPFCC